MSEAKDGSKAQGVGGGRPTHIVFRQERNGATAKLELLWDAAPKTCEAVCKLLPFDTVAWHGTMSGREALCVTPADPTSGIPRDETENCKEMYTVGEVGVLGGVPGEVFNMAKGTTVAELAWIYGPNARAQYWAPCEDEATQDIPGYKLTPAKLNVFARIVEESDFYENCKAMPHTGDQKLHVAVAAD